MTEGEVGMDGQTDGVGRDGSGVPPSISPALRLASSRPPTNGLSTLSMGLGARHGPPERRTCSLVVNEQPAHPAELAGKPPPEGTKVFVMELLKLGRLADIT